MVTCLSKVADFLYTSCIQHPLTVTLSELPSLVSSQKTIMMGYKAVKEFVQHVQPFGHNTGVTDRQSDVVKSLWLSFDNACQSVVMTLMMVVQFACLTAVFVLSGHFASSTSQSLIACEFIMNICQMTALVFMFLSYIFSRRRNLLFINCTELRHVRFNGEHMNFSAQKSQSFYISQTQSLNSSQQENQLLLGMHQAKGQPQSELHRSPALTVFSLSNNLVLRVTLSLSM